MNTEEYVPTVMPQTRANENVCNTGPPQINRATTVRNVRPADIMVRLSVWFTLLFISDSKGSRRMIFKFSRAGVGESADAVWRDLGHEREKVLPRPAAVEPEPEEDFASAPDLPGLIAAEPAPTP